MQFLNAEKLQGKYCACACVRVRVCVREREGGIFYNYRPQVLFHMDCKVENFHKLSSFYTSKVSVLSYKCD
jgi:hypothetical protein